MLTSENNFLKARRAASVAGISPKNMKQLSDFQIAQPSGGWAKGTANELLFQRKKQEEMRIQAFEEGTLLEREMGHVRGRLVDAADKLLTQQMKDQRARKRLVGRQRSKIHGVTEAVLTASIKGAACFAKDEIWNTCDQRMAMRRVSMLEADVFLLDDIVNIPPVVKWIAGLRGSHLVHRSIACSTMPTASNVAFKLLPKLHLGRIVFGSPGIRAGKTWAFLQEIAAAYRGAKWKFITDNVELTTSASRHKATPSGLMVLHLSREAAEYADPKFGKIKYTLEIFINAHFQYDNTKSCFNRAI